MQYQNVELLTLIPNAIIVAVTGGGESSNFSITCTVLCIHALLIMLTAGENVQLPAVASSLPILNTEVILSSRFPQRRISLRITDDSVALEDSEEAVYMLSVVSTQCSVVQISPFDTTTVRVFDDDGKLHTQYYINA